MWDALQGLNSTFEANKPECILASSSDTIMKRFLTNIAQSPLDIHGDEDEPFGYFGQLQNKRQR
jgi:hypothetical protein